MWRKETEITIRSSAAEYLTFVASTGDSDSSYEMRYEDENIWLTQKMMSALYDVSVAAVSRHIKRIYEDGELTPETTINKYLTVQSEGNRQVSHNLDHYNLQMIIAVGFKVNNQRAVQFRKWAGQIVKDYTIQGWTMDKERLKNGHMFTDEYFDRQLQYILEIRLSERKFYQKVTLRPLTMIKMLKLLACFFKWCRTKCILPFTDIPLRNSLWKGQTQVKNIWDWQLGKMPRTERLSRRMLQSQKTI